MKETKSNTKRIEISMSGNLLKKVEDYEIAEDHSTRNSAILELIRKGLACSKAGERD